MTALETKVEALRRLSPVRVRILELIVEAMLREELERLESNSKEAA